MSDKLTTAVERAHTSKAARPSAFRCRLCRTPLRHVFADLGMSPLCESYVSADGLDLMEPTYPLRAFVCGSCFLVQLKEYVPREAIFSEYAYFSSYSDSWVQHAFQYAEMMTSRLGLTPRSLVIEVASNDGYLLQHFVTRQIPALGIEPARNVAAAAVAKGVETRTVFFGLDVARGLVQDGKRADLLIANNVLAQVPDLNDFVAGMNLLLKPEGVITAEFPHLMRLITEVQFDTIYHEHFSYFTLGTAQRAFAAHALTVFDVDELETHGGSLRLYLRHESDLSKPVTNRVGDLRQRERLAGLDDLATYTAFGRQVEEVKRRLLGFLIRVKAEGRSIAAYGAPGKGNTLLNYCGIRTDFLDYTVDRNPYKQGRYLPGTHIPIYHPDRIRETRPDYVLILPWNLKDEIMEHLSYVREWGGQFVVPIPSVRTYP